MSNDNRPKVNVAQLVHQHEDERHLMDYVRVVYKRRWVAIPVFLAVFAIGAINSYRTTPLYRASTQILIEKDTPKVGDLSTIFQQNDGWYNDDFYQTQYRILQSRSLGTEDGRGDASRQAPGAGPRHRRRCGRRGRCAARSPARSAREGAGRRRAGRSQPHGTRPEGRGPVQRATPASCSARSTSRRSATAGSWTSA